MVASPKQDLPLSISSSSIFPSCCQQEPVVISSESCVGTQGVFESMDCCSVVSASYSLDGIDFPEDSLDWIDSENLAPPSAPIRMNMLNVASKAAPDTVMPPKTRTGITDSSAAMDVFLGRGPTFAKHPGHVRLQIIVDVFRQSYDQAKKTAKSDIIRDVVAVFTKCGAQPGKFLKHEKSSDTWFEATDKEARQKVAHLFRDTHKRRLSQSSPSGLSSFAKK